MGSYVQVGGVRTWYEERGEGAPLVLLHGGMGDARDFATNIDALAAHFRVFVPERRGYGHTADVDGPITYELMAQDTIAFLDVVVGGPAHLVGHSDGANPGDALDNVGFVHFSDPDGNGWAVQQICARD